jgi:HTH-type transcriptional regulator/antitoxin HigA
MKTSQKITSQKDYKTVMAKIDKLMSRGSAVISKSELQEIRKYALAAQQYEQATFTISTPTTIAGIIEMKMFELKLKQKDVSRKLKISDAKLSLIMNGKQKPDVNFLKAVHQQLNVSGDFLLNAV